MSIASVDRIPEQAAGSASLLRGFKWVLVATFFITFILAAVIATLIHETHAVNRRIATQMLVQGYAQRIQERLQTALVSTYALASAVRQSSGRLENFNDVAEDLIRLFPGVSALQLAPRGVIRNIYPLQGNEAAMGHDLLADRMRNREAAAAITKRQLTLAGPLDLIQGGVGAVGRLPVFLKNKGDESHFWGFATALIRMPDLLDAAGFGGLARAGYRYELWRIQPDTGGRQVFARSGEKSPADPVEYVMTIYGGRWILSLAPENGWRMASDYVQIFSFSLAAAVALTLLQYFGMRALLSARRF